MLILNEAETKDALPFPALIDALRSVFKGGAFAPERHHHTIPVPGEPEGTLLLMPAWMPGKYFGLKQVSVFPGNAKRGLPSIYGSYLLSSATTGELLAIFDGGELTARRTAAASAMASAFLSRPDAASLLVVGTGRLSRNLVEAHAATRPIKSVRIWGRNTGRAGEIARTLDHLGIDVAVSTDLESDAGSSDIISCATLSETPLIRGEWLKSGTHLDLIGAFKPGMRESDDEAVGKSSLFVDTRAGALSEAGDIIQPIRSGVITSDAITADLGELAAGVHPGRTNADEITLFKSVGASIEDLAAAVLALEQVGRKASDEL